MKSFDVTIVGAGIVGAACAASLAGEGLTVALIDADSPGTGSTAAGMGHIVVMDDSDAQFALTERSRTLWNALADELPAICEYDHCGTIWVAADDVEMNEVRRKHDFYTKRGVRAEMLDASSLLAAEPNLREGLVGGLLVADDSVVYQPAAVNYLIEKATRAGCVVRSGVRAVEITREGVRLESGEFIKSGIALNASGHSAGSLTAGLTIVKRKGHLVITERYVGFVRHQLIELGYLRSAHGTDTHSVAFNVQPRSTGQVLVGSSRQFGVDDSAIDHSIVRQMVNRAFDYMPKLRGLAAVRIWTGFRPATPDNLPYIGKAPDSDNVYVAAGHEGLGITTALATAELIVDGILERVPAISPEPYSPTRTNLEH